MGRLLLLPLLALPACAEPTTNVLLIVVDTLRADHVGCYGYERDTSPNLDALAARGTRYTRAFTHAPWTTPALAALFTSQYPAALGIANVQSRLPDEQLVLSEWLSERGFATSAVVSHSFVSAKWGFAQGFDSFDESQIQGHFATTSPGVSNLAIEWLDAHLEATGGTRPFFLFLHYFDPHFAYVAHAEFPFGRGEGDYAGPVHSGLVPDRFIANPSELAPDDLAELERLYDSEIALTDRAIGRVLDHLVHRGLDATTLVIVTGDHGEEFLDHGALDHTKTLYGELVNVPLIVKRPGQTLATTVAAPVALIDVYPTVIEQLGFGVPAGLRGHPLPLADRSAGDERPIFLETERVRRLRAVVSGRHKLILDLDSGRAQLFDLAADPREREDVAAARPAEVARLRRLIDVWVAERGEPGAQTPLELSDEERDRLRALGYL